MVTKNLFDHKLLLFGSGKMHSSIKKLKPIFITCLCLFLLGNVQALAGMVLCFGSDGHVALEEFKNGACDDSDTSLQTTPPLNSSSSNEHCGQCQDVRFSQASTSPLLRSYSPTSNTLQAHSVVLLTTLLFPAFPSPKRSILPTAPSAGELAQAPLRSIVFLI